MSDTDTPTIDQAITAARYALMVAHGNNVALAGADLRALLDELARLRVTPQIDVPAVQREIERLRAIERAARTASARFGGALDLLDKALEAQR